MAKADATYQPAVYREQGGNALIFATGSAVRYPVITATADKTLTAAMSGLTVLVAADNLTMSLPATAAGLRFRFILTAAGLAAASTAGLKIKPVAADAINGNGLTSVDGNRLCLTATADREGDFVQLIGDGSDGWYITNVSGTWTKTTA